MEQDFFLEIYCTKESSLTPIATESPECDWKKLY